MTDWSTLKKLIWLRIIKGGGSALRTVTGSLIHITDALALPAEALTVNVEPVQAGSGDPSPDNVRPISGRTSATVTRTGINVWDEQMETGDIGSTNGQNSANSSYWRSKNYIPVKANTQYYIASSGSGNIRPRYYRIDKTYISYGTASANNSFTTPNNAYYMRFSPPVEFFPNHDISINYPSTDHDYHSYQGNTYTIQLGQTVYGGTLDVTGGKMVVDRAIVTLDGTNKKFGYKFPDREVYQHTLSTPAKAVSNTVLSKTLCDKLPTQTDNQVQSASADAISTNSAGTACKVCLVSENLGSLASANEWLTSNPLQVCYELATPIEITLTPTQIDMLLGENNLWADAGDLTLTYYADGNASTSEALGILLGGTYNNPGGADDVSDDEALGILLGGS